LKTNIPVDFSSRIKAIRHKLGLTQVRLAELMGVSFASVNRWENGQSRPSVLAWRKIERVEMLGYSALLEAPLQELQIEAFDSTITSVTTNSDYYLSDSTPPVETNLLTVPKLSEFGARSLLSSIEISYGYESGEEKIVMAGLYVREMLTRGLYHRVLIIAPDSMLDSWEREMNNHFDLGFKLLTGIDCGDGNPFKGNGSDLVIASLDLLADDSVFALLRESSVQPYDVAILDEAQSVISRNGSIHPSRSVRRRQIADALAGVHMKDKRWQLPWRARHLLMLSARMQRYFVNK
jgi:transcriptional regulator with XRE-family HTH domain